MKPARLATAALILGGAAAVPPPAAPEAAAARDFLALLRPELREECLRPLGSPERTSWSYLPGRRAGLTLKRMNDAERRAAQAMLRTALSARGYEKTQGVLVLEAILREIEAFGSRRDPDLYYLAIFGAPTDDAPWGWRFEGHHLSLNFSSATGKLVAATPAFFGANPARVEKGPKAGLRVLGAEEDLARGLLASLDARQRRSAVISSSAPSDILMRPGRQPVPAPEGLSAGEMAAGQKVALRRLLDEYFGNMREDVARVQRDKIEKAGIDAIRFAWAGSDRPGQGHYYRLQGPTFLIEYDNTQDGANHVHSVFRDLPDDFGGDALRRHYDTSRAHRSGSAP